VPVEGEALRLDERMRHYGIPALSVAVWKDGKLDWTAGYGNVKADTLLQAGSISKTLTAVATLRVLQKHRIPLDAPINAHLQAWRVPGEPTPTIAQLLDHTAGLNVPGFPGFERGDPIPTLIDELEGRGNTQPLRVVGNTKYSGGGYLLLQQLLVELEKKPIDAILEAEVLRPAKMRDSTFAQPLRASVAKRAAGGTDEDGEAIRGGSYIYPEKTAAGLWTTSADLARFLIALQTSKLVPRDAIVEKNFGVLPFALHYFAHPGGNAGFFAIYVAHRTRADGAVVLPNHENAEPLVNESCAPSRRSTAGPTTCAPRAAAARTSSQRVLEALKTHWSAPASWRQVYRNRAERHLH
jgi:CubicO group peptidase (beta-lactamase class C family)